MTFTPAMLRHIGNAMYGPNWQGPLGKDLDVSDRTMRDWQNDDARLPPGLPGELRELCAKRAQILTQLASALTSGDEAALLGRPNSALGQTQVYAAPRRPGEIRKR